MAGMGEGGVAGFAAANDKGMKKTAPGIPKAGV